MFARKIALFSKSAVGGATTKMFGNPMFIGAVPRLAQNRSYEIVASHDLQQKAQNANYEDASQGNARQFPHDSQSNMAVLSRLKKTPCTPYL